MSTRPNKKAKAYAETYAHIENLEQWQRAELVRVAARAYMAGWKGANHRTRENDNHNLANMLATKEKQLQRALCQNTQQK